MKFVRAIIIAFVLLLVSSISLFGQTVRKESFQGREVVAGEIIVRFKPNAASAGQTIASQDSDIASTEQVGRNGAIVMRSRGRNASELVRAYAGRADVEYAEPNYVWHASDFPNDPLFGQQWGLHNTGQGIGGQSGLVNADIHALQAWDLSVGSHGIVVGVVDSGMDYTHPDLIPNLWTGPNFGFTVTINGQTIQCGSLAHGFNAITRTCDPLDDEGHGTHVSGIIGAAGGNGLGVTGVSRISTIMPLKFLDSTGSGTTANAIAAIEFAIQVKAVLGVNLRVLNNSWGGGGFSQALLDEINSANSSDMLFVVAAGNDGVNTDSSPEYPASYSAPNLITVAATDNRDALWSSSNFGATTVNLGAPGVNIESTLRGGTYGLATGTSMATPMVSGSAALVLASCPMATSSLRSILLSTVDQISSLSGKTTSGGRLDVGQALAVCNGAGTGTFILTTDSSNHVAGFSGSTTFNITATAVGGFSGSVGLSASNLPAGASVTFNPPSIAGSETSAMKLTLPPNISPGTYPIRVTGIAGSISQVINPNVIVPGSVSVPQSTGGVLATTDLTSPEHPGSFADYIQFTISTPTSITIDMRSSLFDSFLYLLSTSGTVLNSDNDSGGGVNARIGPTVLAAGTYMIESTSVNTGGVGAYFLGINCATLNTVTPASGQAGSTINVTLSGDRFIAPASIAGLPFVSVSNLVVVDSHTITATLAIGQAASPGTYNMTVTSAGSAASNSVPFVVTQAFPVLTSVLPAIGVPGTNVPVRFDGFGMDPSMTVNAGDGISVSALNSGVATLATMTFSISPGASVGVHSVTFTNSVGTSNPVSFIVTNQAPVLTSVSPSFGTIGTSVTLTVIGSNFVNPLSFDAGPGITFTLLSGPTATQASVVADISATATLGTRNFTLTSPAGTSNALAFTVNPVFVVLTSINPDHVGQGSTIDITLTGTGFNAPMTVDAGPDISVSNIVVTSSKVAKATLSVSGSASIGVRNLTATTSANTSNPVPLTVLAPFPDLVIADSRAPSFGVGFNENYVVTVTNAGSVPTTDPTTLTYDFNKVTFVSGTGTGWSCSLTTATRATCTFPGILDAGLQSSINLTVAVGNVGTTTAGATFIASTAGDLSVVNNSLSDSTSIVGLPSVVFSNSVQVNSATQINVTLGGLNPSFPHPLSGTISLAFAPGSTNPIDDPAIQFSTGGRQVAFTIPANSNQVQFAGNSTLALQTGTVAGSLTLSATIQSTGTVQPALIPSRVLTSSGTVPKIVKATMDTQSGLAISVTLFSNTRELTFISFTFVTPGVEVKLSCANVAGCTATGSTITFDIQTISNDWYASDVTYGGLLTLRVPFTMSASLFGNVSVNLVNSKGSTGPTFYSLP